MLQNRLKTNSLGGQEGRRQRVRLCPPTEESHFKFRRLPVHLVTCWSYPLIWLICMVWKPVKSCLLMQRIFQEDKRKSLQKIIHSAVKKQKVTTGQRWRTRAARWAAIMLLTAETVQTAARLNVLQLDDPVWVRRLCFAVVSFLLPQNYRFGTMKTAHKKQRGRTQEKLFKGEVPVHTNRAQTRLKYIQYSIFSFLLLTKQWLESMTCELKVQRVILEKSVDFLFFEFHWCKGLLRKLFCLVLMSRF